MGDPTFGLPERQRIGPVRDVSRSRTYAAAAKHARWWIRQVAEAWEDNDASELVRLMNFRGAVLESLESALNPSKENDDGPEDTE